MDIILFLLVAYAGHYLGKLLRLPNYVFLGPMFLVAILSILGLEFQLWPHLKTLFAVILGGFVGLRFELKGKEMTKTALIISFWMLASAVLVGNLLILLGIDPPTALFSASPGGTAEISVTAMSFGANTFYVTLLQTSRMLAILFLIPFIVKRYNIQTPSEQEDETENKSKSTPPKIIWAKLSLIAIGAAFIGYYLHIPAYDLLGPLFGVFIYTRIKKITLKPINSIQNLAMMGAGGIIGVSVTKEIIMEIPTLLLPALVLSILTLLSGLVLAYALQKITKWDMVTCLLATAPAGYLPMMILAEDMHADAAKVAVLQIIRLFSVVALAPIIYSFLL